LIVLSPQYNKNCLFSLYLFFYFYSHLLLQVSAHIDWQTPKNRSREYVEVIQKELGNRAVTNKSVTKIQRSLQEDQSMKILVTDQHGLIDEFDRIVFACHPDQILRILDNEVSEFEQQYLSQFHYTENKTYVHWDEDLMPKSKAAWTSWNYLGSTKYVEEEEEEKQRKPVFVTYWLNKLQSLQVPNGKNILVSLNPFQPPATEKTWTILNYAHPQYSLEAVHAQRQIAQLQGQLQTYYCGAWMGYGFHEDGFRSGIEVAMAISGVPVPWVMKYGQQTLIPAPKVQLQQLTQRSYQSIWKNAFTSWLTSPLQSIFQTFCQQQVITFLKQGFEKGRLVFKLMYANGQELELIGENRMEKECKDVTVCVYHPNFFVRLALEADIGMSRGYIAGEWEVQNTGPYADGLTYLLQLLLDNMPTGQTKKSGGFDVKNLMTAWIGSALNAVWFHIAMDNTIANSRSNIHAVSLFVFFFE
jgi:hypothetical protein